MTITKNSDQTPTESSSPGLNLNIPPMSSEMDSESTSSAPNLTKPFKLTSRISMDRCLICFRLVRNSKGNRLTKYHDLNATLNDPDDSDLSVENPNLTNSSSSPESIKHSINGDLNKNKSSSNSEHFNLVKGNKKEEEDDDEVEARAVYQKQTIGEKIFASLKCSSTLLDRNSCYLKKVCDTCYREVCMVEFHLKSARRLTDLITFKLKKSSQLVGTNVSRMRTMSICSAARRSNGRTQRRIFNKRKVLDDSRYSSLNLLTKIARNELSMSATLKQQQQLKSNSNKTSVNHTASTHTTKNNYSHIDHFISHHSARQSTPNGAKPASYRTCGPIKNSYNSSSELTSPDNVNNSFKSIHDNNHQSISHFGTADIAGSSKRKQDLTSSQSLNHKTKNFNRNASNSQLNQNEQRTKQEQLLGNNFRPGKSGHYHSKNDLSDNVSEASYNSHFEQTKQQQQEMGSRRKRKSVNPSRLMKDLQTDINNNPLKTENLEDRPNHISDLPKQHNYPPNYKRQQVNGHNPGLNDRRHHSADSFQKYTNLSFDQKQLKAIARQHATQKQIIKPAKIENQKADNGLEMRRGDHGDFMKLINNKENYKYIGMPEGGTEKMHSESNDETDTESRVEEYSEHQQNGLEEVDGAHNDQPHYVMNDLDHDIDNPQNDVDAYNENYLVDGTGEDEEDPDDHKDRNELDLPETDNDLEIDIDEVEADAEEDDQEDQETDEGDCGSIVNDENHNHHNGFKNSSSMLKQRRKLNMVNGGHNSNKLAKKIFNIKNEMIKGNVTGFNTPDFAGAVQANRGYAHVNNNKAFDNKNHVDQPRFLNKRGVNQNQLKTNKKLNSKNNSNENLVRSGNHNNNNGNNFYMGHNAAIYDENSNSKSNPNFVSPSLSESPSPSQMVENSPMSRSYLNSYLNTSNSNGLCTNTKHACEVCKKTFKTQNILRQHMRIHTGDKPFVCDICNKAFSQMASLKYHLATHSDARPYRCEVCSKTFKLKPPFKKHIKECQPKLMGYGGKNEHYQHSDQSPQQTFTNYYNPGFHSNGLEMEANEEDE